MNISDLISVRRTARAVDLAAIADLLQTLQQEGESLSLSSASGLQEILSEYVAPADGGRDALRQILQGIAASQDRGTAALVRGARGTGKSHLLGVMALLLEHPAAWPVFAETHPTYEHLRSRLEGREYLVVPIPLSEHHGHDEHLEDIVFDRTEQVLASVSSDRQVVLSEQSYALDLVDRHILPRYSSELDEYTRQQEEGADTWQELREGRPDRAVEIARQFTQQAQYPLDFRQSRVERLSMLLEIVQQSDLEGVVWLLDDLTQFLAGVGRKAVHGDCTFLDFVGQRCKISPLHLVATVTETLDHLTGLESYLLNAIQSSYRTDMILDTDQTRAVLRQRTIVPIDEEEYAQAISEVYAAYEEAFGRPSFDEQQLSEAYPLHPIALEGLESIAERFFGAADTVMRFTQDLLDDTHLAGLLDRDFRQLIPGAEVFEYLRPRIAAHPQASAYVHEVLDYFDKNASDVYEADPELCMCVARLLILFRLANTAASVPLLVEAAGLDSSGQAVASAEQVREVLEAMRLFSPYVGTRGEGDGGPTVYYIDAHTSVSEALRRRIAAIKASFDDGDDGLWRQVISSCDEVGFPLCELGQARTLEVQWQNTYRCISAQLADLTQMTAEDVNACMLDLQDAATIEDVCLLVADPRQVDRQRAMWQRLGQSAPDSRWAGAVIAWLPEPWTPQQLDEFKEFAAVSKLLESQQEESSDSAVTEQLSQMYASLSAEVRRAVAAGYHQGEVVSLVGRTVGPEDLGPVRGNWAGTMETIAGPSLAQVFPDFAQIAPRRPLISRRQVDTLVDDLIRPGEIELEADDPEGDLIGAIMRPLGLARQEDGRWVLDVSESEAATEVLERVTRRDQSARTEASRPIACADLAQHLVKSPLGLPPELFELTVAALVRTGHLAVVGEDQRLLGLQQVDTPLSRSVRYVAQPPVLGHQQWQALARICRTALDAAVPAPGHAAQQRVWELLVEKRENYLNESRDLQQRLEKHIEELDQRPRQWERSFSDIEAMRELFEAVEPRMHAAAGIQQFVEQTERFVDEAADASLLLALFRRLNNLAEYLDELADGVVSVREYLLSHELNIERHQELQQRREAVLSAIDGGEQLVNEELNLRRLTQMFLGAYKRAYISWHSKVYRGPIFDQYRAIQQSSQMQALDQLSKLHVEVDVTADDMVHRIEQQAARRCQRSDLSEALNESPVCPDCRLQLHEEPELVEVEELREEVRAAIRGYLAALLTPSNRQRLREYAQSTAGKGEAAAHLHRIAGLDTDVSSRQIISLFTDAAISYINRALAGKRIRRRNFGQLQKALQGRTLTKKEAHEVFIDWLQGDEGEQDAEGLLRIEG